MPVDFESVKKLPADDQVTEFKKIVTSLEKQIKDLKTQLAGLEKEEKSEERDKKIIDAKKALDENTRDRNSAEQLLARSEIESKALETVLTERRAGRNEEEEQGRARERQELENIVQQERTRDTERKQPDKRPEDAYKPTKGYETQSVYEKENKFYDNANPTKTPDKPAYKTSSEEQRDAVRSMYAGGSGQEYQH